jgi:ribosome maturation factor RimP
MKLTVKCTCGHEFVLASEQFSMWADECECCGYTYHLEVSCPGCRETLVLQKTLGEE